MILVKQTISISIDSEIILKVKKIAEDNNMKISEVASKVFEAGFKMGEPISVKCPMCSTIYLNKEGFCPKCKQELIEREQTIIKETQIIELKNRLNKLLEWKSKGLWVTDNEINKINERINTLEHDDINKEIIIDIEEKTE